MKKRQAEGYTNIRTTNMSLPTPIRARGLAKRICYQRNAQKSKIAARRSEGSERACKTLNTLMACGCPYTLVSLQWELGVQNTKFKCETPNILPRGGVFLLARQWCKCQRVDVFKVDSFSLVSGTLGLALVFPPTTDGCYQSHTEYLFRVCELASTSRVASLVSLGSRLHKLPFPFS